MIQIFIVNGHVVVTEQGVLISKFPITDVLTRKNRLRLMGYGMKNMVAFRLSYNTSCQYKYINMRDVKRFQTQIERRVASGLATRQFQIVGQNLLEKADELCLVGQCAEALPLLETSCKFGITEARARLAWLLSEGREGIPKDAKRAFDLVREDSRLGCKICLGVMANFLFDENVVPCCVLDWWTADEYLQESSGTPYSGLLLAYFYYYGKNREEDETRALELFIQAAEKNQISVAYIQVATIIKCGSEGSYGSYGSEERDSQAFEWNMKAAKQGHPKGLFNVAKFFEKYGKKDEAIHWYSRAQAAGHEHAEECLKLI
jgi:TPR repeat protein